MDAPPFASSGKDALVGAHGSHRSSSAPADRRSRWPRRAGGGGACGGAMAGAEGAVEIVTVTTTGDVDPGPPAGRNRRQGAVDQGARPRARRRRGRFLRPFDEGCRKRAAGATSGSPRCCPRADVRDRLIGADSIDALARRRGGRHVVAAPRRPIASASARPPDRARSAAMSRPGIAKVAAGEVDATLLAAAGLDRLGLAVGVADARFRSSCPPRARRRSGSNAAATMQELVAMLGAVKPPPSHRLRDRRARLHPGAWRHLRLAGRGAGRGRARRPAAALRNLQRRRRGYASPMWSR